MSTRRGCSSPCQGRRETSPRRGCRLKAEEEERRLQEEEEETARLKATEEERLRQEEADNEIMHLLEFMNGSDCV